MKRVILAMILLIALSALLFGCGKPAAKTDTASKPAAQEQTVTDNQAGAQEETAVSEASAVPEQEQIRYTFRNAKLLNQHYEKHGREMGFSSAAEYEAAASAVANDPGALHKTEKEDGDDVYYLEETNEFVVVSTDGYIRTYFYPNAGKKYFDRQ